VPMSPEPGDARPVALVTGVGRRVGIAAGLCQRLAGDGWDLAITFWSAYDERQPWGRQPHDVDAICGQLRERGARVVAVEADLADPAAPGRLLRAANGQLGPVTALIMAHTEGTPSGILDTTVESFDRHYAVNVRASWLLIREYARQPPTPDGSGRIVALTSDHVVGNLPYGATKGALDRIVIAAARELADLRVTANVINPGPIDTGWMTEDQRRSALAVNPRGRLGTPADTAALVSFLCSPEGGWINGQLLSSDGGWNV
jgi:3-oxoacyl-[acyl-carrier protein] reductase